ncbi:MAG: YitT family protein [Bacillota bacterium]|nr:YitT family protein [Bacillota bacterium]
MKLQINKKEVFNRATLLDLLTILCGVTLYSLVIDVFILPNDLLAAGFTGIAIVVHHFIPALPVSLSVYVINIPIILWARKEIDTRFILYTIFAVTVQSLSMELFDGIYAYTNDVFMACLFGGILAGFGTGLVIRRRGSGGGLDILCIVFKKRYGISVGTVGIAFNIIVIGLSSLIYGLELAMYTLCFIAISYVATDKAIDGFSKRYTALIVTQYPHAMKDAIIQRLHRGVTFIYGEGGFSGLKRELLYCVVNQYEMAALKKILEEIDVNAFMTLMETREIYGRFHKRGSQNPDPYIVAQRELEQVFEACEIPKTKDEHHPDIIEKDD